MNDDVAYVHAMIKILVNCGRNLILVLHDEGGPVGSHAIQGLSAAEREKNGQQGGVVRIVFVAASVHPEGPTPATLPFSENHVSCKNMTVLESFRINTVSGL